MIDKEIKSIADLIKTRALTPDKRNTKEYQAYGNKLADEFNDQTHRALYIKLAKNEDRALLEIAREYVKGAEKAHTKGRLFMWKFSQLKNAKKELKEQDK